MLNLLIKHKISSHHLKRHLAWASVDIAIMVVAYVIAFEARAVTATLDPIIESAWFILFAIVTMIVSLTIFSVYFRIWKQTSGHDVSIIVNAVTLATLIVSLVNITISPQRPLPMSVVLLGNGLSLIGFVAIRYQSRLISGLSWRWKAIWHEEFPEQDTRRVLIVGAGESGALAALRLKHHFHTQDQKERYHIVGFVDDDPDKQGLYVEGSAVLGTRQDILYLVETYSIDLIIMAIHKISGPDFREILNYCEITGAMIKVVPDMLGLMASKHTSPLLRDVQVEDYLGRSPIGRHDAVDFAPIHQKIVLVTGAAGSIGSELSRQLLHHQPSQLILLDFNESGLHDLMVEIETRLDTQAIDLQPVLADITHRDRLQHIFEQYRPQVIFHAAAYKHVPMLEKFPREAVRVNIGGTLHLAELCSQYNVERFVLISTDKAVNPSSIMGATKRICEMIVLSIAEQPDCQTRFTSVRFGNVLWSRGSVVPTFNSQIDAGGPITITNKEMRRYFMSTQEAANLVLHAACLTNGGDLYMLKMGELIRILDLAERMIRMRGLRPYKDISIKFIGNRPGEKLFEELQERTEAALPTLHPNIVQLIRTENGLYPESFMDAVRQLMLHGLDTKDPLQRLKTLIGSHKHLEPLQ